MAENDQHYNGSVETDQAAPAFRIPEAAPETTQAEQAGMGTGETNTEAQPRLLLPYPDDGMPSFPGSLSGAGSGMNSGTGSAMNSGMGTGTGSGANSGANSGTGSSMNSGCATCGWLPTFPGFPAAPQYYSQVRFLNASTNSFPVNISIDNTAYAINSRFGTVSNYDQVADGFHTVTVRRASGVRSILLQQTYPFAAGQKVTFVLADSSSGGLELVRVVDSACRNLPSNTGCFRFANMSYSGSRVNLLLGNNETVFRNVGFQQVTSYKQAVAGSYPFTVVSSSSVGGSRELQIIVIGVLGNASGTRAPLLTFRADIAPGKSYTSYLIGNTWSGNSLRVLTVTD